MNEKFKRKELRHDCHDRHTVSLLTDHLVFSPKRIKGSRSRILRKEFLHLKECCDDQFRAPSCFHGSVGNGWDVVKKYIRDQDTYEYNRDK